MRTAHRAFTDSQNGLKVLPDYWFLLSFYCKFTSQAAKTPCKNGSACPHFNNCLYSHKQLNSNRWRHDPYSSCPVIYETQSHYDHVNQQSGDRDQERLATDISVPGISHSSSEGTQHNNDLVVTQATSKSQLLTQSINHRKTNNESKEDDSDGSFISVRRKRSVKPIKVSNPHLQFCKDCNATWELSEEIKQWFRSKSLQVPLPCVTCREVRKQQAAAEVSQPRRPQNRIPKLPCIVGNTPRKLKQPTGMSIERVPDFDVANFPFLASCTIPQCSISHQAGVDNTTKVVC